MTRARSSNLASKPARVAARTARQMPKMSDEVLPAHETNDVHDNPSLPVRVYETDGRVMVAAPMPGLEPQDISVAVAGNHVTIHGVLRGPHQDERDLSVAEWTFGPYHRDLTLLHPVDGARANATYGNGVLVLALPKDEPGESGRDARFTLKVLSPTRGARIGHAGRDLRRTTTAAQQSKQRDVVGKAGNSNSDARPDASTDASTKVITTPDQPPSRRSRREPSRGPVNV